MIESIKTRGAALGTMVGTMLMVGLITAGSASAAGDPVDAAFTEFEGKITTYGGAIVGLVVLAAGIFLGIKYLRKGAAKA